MAIYSVIHVPADRQWASWIGKELLRLGHGARFCEQKSGLEADVFGQFNMDWDERVICVVSRAFIAHVRKGCRGQSGLLSAPAKGSGTVLAVWVDPCCPPASGDFRRCEIFGIPEDWARQRFGAIIAEETEAATASPRGERSKPGSLNGRSHC